MYTTLNTEKQFRFKIETIYCKTTNIAKMRGIISIMILKLVMTMEETLKLNRRREATV